MEKDILILIIILWYNKRVSKDEIIRTYIKLYEYET